MDDAFEPELAGMAEHHLAVLMLQVLIQPQARTGLGQDGGERGLPQLQRLAAQVVAIQLRIVRRCCPFLLEMQGSSLAAEIKSRLRL